MKAHELLADKSKWTQGRRVSRREDGLLSWCADGALSLCYRDKYEYEQAHRKAMNAADCLFGRGLIHVNDRLGYEAVMQVLREADV